MSAIPSSGQTLYVLDLAHRLQQMEHGPEPIDPVAYRLFAKRLRQALAGCPLARLPDDHTQPPALAEALANRYFTEHGQFEDRPKIAASAGRLLMRLQRRSRSSR
jgi:hypothetical protein